ncbi:hypothetical protein CHS0354_019965 [Potamilus streckersoni]|uniref:Uncharacterized protein n=1 Tax=Potamilus streckersoni TaxID=2493646 RepID=A0AAE0S0Z5_9BIVA|nr:hypothetical protein CHS0354_019965 [Potamilus streckersoni]
MYRPRCSDLRVYMTLCRLTPVVKTAVNQKRHTSCKVSIDPVEFSPGMTTYIQWQRSFFAQRNNMIFHNPKKPPGARLNLYRAERTYSSRNLMELKRKQYMHRLNQSRRAFQGVHGNREFVYLKYMRYINQSKTVPLPSKSGWRRTKWVSKLVTSGESTKDYSQKQRTIDKKVCSSSNVLEKSQSDQFGNLKPEIKKQAKTEVQKRKSPKDLSFTDQAVILVSRPQRSIPSFPQSHNGPSTSSTNSGSQKSREKGEDVHSKGELKDVMEIGADIERKNSDKPLSSRNENQQRQIKPKEEVDMPMYLQGHMSSRGSIHETLQEEDHKSKDFEQREYDDEINKKSKEHDHRLSDIERPESSKGTISKAHEKLQEEDQISNYSEERESPDEMNKNGQEHKSPLLAIENPDSKESASSKGHEKMQEEDQELTDFEQREYADEINKNNQESDSYPSAVETPPESGKVNSSIVHEKLQDQNSTDLEHRKSPDEINKRSQEHDYHPSVIERPNSGKNNLTNVLEKFQKEDQKSIELDQREPADEMDRKSHANNPHASPVERPDSVKKTSDKVHANLQEDQKSTNLKNSEAAHEMDKKSQEYDTLPSNVNRSESGKSTSSEDKGEQTQASINGVEENKT